MKFRSICHVPELKLVYLNNPKVACSTIKLSLWTKVSPDTVDDELHRSEHSPFERAFADEDRSVLTVFSVVRDPLRRFLSAYIQKCHRGFPDHRAWIRMAGQIGLDPAVAPDPDEFVARMTSGKFKIRDHHFVPQHINLLAGQIKLDHLFKLENIAACREFLESRDIAWQVEDRHRTDPAEIKPLSPDSIAALARYYERDYAQYDYPLPDPETWTAPPRPRG